MPDFKSLKELEVYLQAKINQTLNNQVASAVKEQIAESVIDVVYMAGEPVKYERRNLHSGSLGDTTQMNHTVGDGVLEVTDDADFNNDFANRSDTWGYGSISYGRTLAENIAYGYGDQMDWWNKPRNFMEDAKNKLRVNKKHVEAMRKGLSGTGVKVE